MNSPSAINVLADDTDVIPYRRRLRKIAGSALGAILLQQILFRAKNNRWKPFYKFGGPCSHSDYSEGDSWTEELGFSDNEFETARSLIASKITKGKNRSTVTPAVVFFWTDSNRKTWYDVNIGLLNRLVEELYDDESAKDALRLYIESRESVHSKKRRKAALHSSESTESVSKKREISNTEISLGSQDESDF